MEVLFKHFEAQKLHLQTTAVVKIRYILKKCLIYKAEKAELKRLAKLESKKTDKYGRPIKKAVSKAAMVKPLAKTASVKTKAAPIAKVAVIVEEPTNETVSEHDPKDIP